MTVICRRSSVGDVGEIMPCFVRCVCSVSTPWAVCKTSIWNVLVLVLLLTMKASNIWHAHHNACGESTALNTVHAQRLREELRLILKWNQVWIQIKAGIVAFWGAGLRVSFPVSIYHATWEKAIWFDIFKVVPGILKSKPSSFGLSVFIFF